MESVLFQIHISLKYLKPRIWRRVLVAADTPVEDFHKIIQTTMGWENSHLHHFIKDNHIYSIPFEENLFGFGNIDYTGIKIRELLLFEGDKILYEYDFGDDWQHEILLEKILFTDTRQKHPVCLKGKRACPPEDCGGVWGYNRILEIMENPQHPDYDDTMEWIGDDFLPVYFNVDQINAALKRNNYGCFDRNFF